MNIAEIFVRHRVLAYMMSAAIMLFGAIGMRDIGTDRMPNVDIPALVITTVYPGAGPAVVDASVTSVIESAINSVSDIDTIESSSRPGLSEIFVQFRAKKDPDAAFNETQSKLNQVLNELPLEAERPIVVKLDPNATPVIRLFLAGDRSLSELNRLARVKVKKALESAPGVGEVRVGGGRERKIRVDIDLDKLSALQLTAQDVIEAFSREHIQVPGGYLVGGMLEKLLYLDLEFHTIEELGELVVVSRDQVPVKLKHIAELSDGLEDKRALTRFNGREGVAVSVFKVRGANTVAIVKAVEKKLDNGLREQLPDGVELLIATNEADVIEKVVGVLRNHLVEGTLLSGLVVFVFLLNVPATLIIGTAVPVSLAGSIMVMYFGGYTLNVLTMSGLLLLIGVVVDDAIVVLENIHRHHAVVATDPELAAINGTREVLLAVAAASATLLCIFGTVIFAEGMIGVFLRSFAVVVAVGVAVSLLVSVTLTPALCARFLTSHKLPENRLLRRIEAGHQWLERIYSKLLEASLLRRGWVMLLSLAIVASTGFFMSRLGGEFFPEDDESRYRILIEAPLGSSIDYTVSKLNEIEGIVRKYPEVLHVLSSVGSARSGDVNEALLQVELVPKSQRILSQFDLMYQARRDLMRIAGVEIYVSATPVTENMNADPFEAVITGPDVVRLAGYAHQIHRDLNTDGRMGTVRLGLNLDRPQLTFNIDRDRALALGISTRQIGDTVRVLAGGADIAKYNSLSGDGERYDVQLAAIRSGMQDTRDLEGVYMKGPEEQLIPLGAVVDISGTKGPAVLERTDLQYSARFSSTPDVSTAEAGRLFAEIAEAVLPPGYDHKPVGQSAELENSTNTLIFIFVTGLLLVYMVLASQFNSFLQPAIIMLAQPLAIVGGVFALWLTGGTLNIFSMIGLVLLVGLVSKNSILLVDLINQYRDQGMETREAILEACPRRMRPVLMTSLTIVLAMTPAAVGAGAGAGLYGPLAVAVIGGVVSSTLLTLIVVPVAYSLLERWLGVTEQVAKQAESIAGLTGKTE